MTVEIPDAIDLTGQTDCSRHLELWLSNLPAGSAVEFRSREYTGHEARIRIGA